MKLRALLQTRLILAAIIVMADSTGRLVAAEADQPQYYELRVYTTKSEAQQKLINDYWQKAAVPAYNRLGIPAVGVFTEQQDSATNKVYVLIPFETPGAYAAIPIRLAADAAYQTSATD